MSRSPAPHVRRTVEAAKCVLVGAMAFLAVTSTAAATATDAGEPGPVAEEMASAPAAQTRVDALMERHDCSATGFGADVIPGSSLVLQDSRVRHVSFDEGWSIYTGQEPGVLLAVCRPAP